MTIHREGHRILLSLIVILLIINGAIFSFLPDAELVQQLTIIASSVVFILVLQFFRSPNRKQNLSDDWVLCPADGKIVAIEEVEEPEYYQGKRLQVSVFMSPLNVHVNRYAISGKVTYFKYHEGLYLIASHPKSSTENERTTVVVENGSRSVLVRQIAGAVARRIVTYAKLGDAAKQGGEFGFIKFGSRVDIFMPTDVNVQVKLGEVVKGGITVIAKFPNK
jgi:phosphatidylserine decarboxylase